jgi:hypothetical protein
MAGMRDLILVLVHVIVTIGPPSRFMGASVQWLLNPRCSGISF